LLSTASIRLHNDQLGLLITFDGVKKSN